MEKVKDSEEKYDFKEATVYSNFCINVRIERPTFSFPTFPACFLPHPQTP
jgi:hypothetical protein